MNNPLDSRKNYLKTLNDELLSKTESDILVINRHEAKRSKIVLPPELTQMNQYKSESYVHQTLHFEEEESINIIGNSELFYKLDCRNKSFPLRITFKKVKGQLRFLASFKHKYPTPQQADYNFVVEKDIRRALPPRGQNRDTLYICFSSGLQLGMVKIFVDSYIQHMQKISRAQQSTETRKKKSVKSVSFVKLKEAKADQSQEENQNNIKTVRTLIPYSKLNRSIQKDDNHLQRNKNQVINYRQVSSQKLIKYREKEIAKYVETKARRQEIQKYKEKNREFKIKASESKELIQFRKEKIKQQIIEKQHLVKNLATMVEICKFFTVLSFEKKKLCEKLLHNSKITTFQANFVRKLKNKMKKSKFLLPNIVDRNKANLRMSLCLVGWAIQNKNFNKISSNVGSLLITYSLASRVNGILSQATEYRRKIRYIQKFWKLKYQTRLQMIQNQGKIHTKSMISQFKQFKDVQLDFQLKGILSKIAIQYVKDTTNRFNAAYLGYFKKLQSINDIQKMNKNISEQNLKLAKRNQKALLKVPLTPSKPYARYFRDLDTFKSMLRAWFQLQSKKYEKRFKKQKQLKQTKDSKVNVNNMPKQTNGTSIPFEQKQKQLQVIKS